MERTVITRAARLPGFADPTVEKNDAAAATPGIHPLLAPANADRREATLQLLRLARDLGARLTGGNLTDDEAMLLALAERREASPRREIERNRAAIRAGHDPLGEELCRRWPAAERRPHGAFYTDPNLVAPMIAWTLARDPERLVDAGCGSGRFAAAAIRQQPSLPIVAVDLDPVATLLTRANLAVLGAEHARVLQVDYTTLDLPVIAGRTAYIGNPPYVRHHDLSPAAKAWAKAAGRRLGHPVSALAGLHAYFYLATALAAKPGDIGCFITSAEWLDVRYGAIIRELFLNGLGGQSLHVVDPRAIPFADAMTTAAIACFEVGTREAMLGWRSIEAAAAVASLDAGPVISRAMLGDARRWSPLFRLAQPLSGGLGEQTVPLRQVARVHRGAVTGANDFFVLTRDRARALGVEPWCRAVICGAKEILDADGIIRAHPGRKLLLDVPADIDRGRYPALDAYLRQGEQPRGDAPPIATRYVASRRRPWWHLGIGSPPPIIATYMTRQAPAFALNPDGLAIINIAHGLYPIQPLSPDVLRSLVAALNNGRASFQGAGRTYHGGLEKFEPSEMEALPVPASFVAMPWSE